MKWLILFALFLFLLMMISVRFKRQIIEMIQVWKVFKQVNNPPEKQIKKESDNGDISLIKCAKCGNWIPQNETMNFRSTEFYCSVNCVEKSAV